LVCLSEEITVGQAIPGSSVDVPVLGDLSRRHVLIRREGDGYLIRPVGEVRVEGRKISRDCVLADGDEIEMGESVRMRFRQPHALSVSARLDLVSHHRPQPSADAILLMADACILGPGARNHVVCRHWSGDVVLFRTKGGQLHCRAGEWLEIDGTRYSGQGPLTPNSRVTGSDFALSLEAL
jgi:hypothetical protein